MKGNGALVSLPSEAMPENKKQHYVSLFYLRRFSADGKTIGLYNFAKMLTKPEAPLRNQCYEDYFYGKDASFEKTLGGIEKKASKLLLSIDQKGCLPPHYSPEHIMMIIYILLQGSRTKYAADNLEDSLGEMMEPIFPIKIENASQVACASALKYYPFLLDLEYKLLTNHTGIGFITSDNPVAKINPLMLFRNKFGNAGLAAKGLQVWFPIDPDKVILLYDRDVYRVGGNKKTVIEIIDYQDVYNINTLQACSCYENIYFKEENFGAKYLHRKAGPYMRTRKNKKEDFPQEDGSLTTVSSNENIRFSPTLSFVSIRSGAKKWRRSFQSNASQPVVVPRNRAMYNDYREFRGLVRAGKYGSADFLAFLAEKHSKS
jgi:hypothetical protein